MKTISCLNTAYNVSDNHSISHDDKEISWSECDLKIGTFKWCPVYYCQIETNIYIKPVRPELDYNFEKIFGFGMCCQGYDNKKVVWLKDAILS